jgi:hypothetical protein
MDHVETLALLGHLHNITGSNGVRRNIHFPIVDKDVSVSDDLSCSGPRGSKPQAIDDVIETTFEPPQKILTGNTLFNSSLLEKITKLPLENSIDASSLLLLPQMDSIIRRTALGTLAVLTWSVPPSFKTTLFKEASLTLQEEFRPFLPA